MRILLIAYDNKSFIHWYPQGLGYIAAVLKNAGYEVVIYNQDKHHYPDEHLTQYLDNNKFDLVGLGLIAGYYQYKKLLKISESINNSKNRPFYAIAGHGPTPDPEYFLRKTNADVAILGEGEETTVDLVEALSENRPLKDVKGIAYIENDKIQINERRPLIKDIDNIPYPGYEMFPIDYYRLLRVPRTNSADFVMPLLSGRGCPFKCNFCYRMDQGFRPRSSEGIVEEIQYLKKNYSISFIAFSDELLMSSIDRTVNICETFIKSKLNIKWNCNGRLNFVTSDLIKLMKEAGCQFINYGIEAFDDQVLKNMNKVLTTKQIVHGIETTLEHGISPGLNIIFGNIGDNKKTLEKDVEFLIQYDDCAQLRTIRPVTPYPGSPLYYLAIEKGLLKDCEDFYENKHINSDLLSVNFTELSDDEFHKSLLEANIKLINNHYNTKTKQLIETSKKLY